MGPRSLVFPLYEDVQRSLSWVSGPRWVPSLLAPDLSAVNSNFYCWWVFQFWYSSLNRLDHFKDNLHFPADLSYFLDYIVFWIIKTLSYFKCSPYSHYPPPPDSGFGSGGKKSNSSVSGLKQLWHVCGGVYLLFIYTVSYYVVQVYLELAMYPKLFLNLMLIPLHHCFSAFWLRSSVIPLHQPCKC